MWRLWNWGRWGRQAGGPRIAEAVLWRMVVSHDDDGWAEEGPAEPPPEPIDQTDAEELDPHIHRLPEPYRTRLLVRYYLTTQTRKERRQRLPDSLELGEALRALQDRLDQ